MILPLGGGALGDGGFSPPAAPVTPPLSGATPADGGMVAAVWGVQILIDGTDVSTSVIGSVLVEAEEGTARVADFSLCLAPGDVLDVPSWTGRAVTILFCDMTSGVPSGATALFNGVVDIPTVDLRERCARLRCTDDLQGVLAALSRPAIDALVGGRWSPVVFDPAAGAYVYCQDCLSTVPASVDLKINGTPRRTSWVAKTVPDLSFTDDQVLDGSPVPQFAERAFLTNQVDLTFSYRFPRQKSEGYQVNYDFMALYATSFGIWVRDGNSFLNREAVIAAIEAGGGSIVSVTWTPLPTTAQVIPGTGGAPAGTWLPNPLTDVLFCLGFSIVVAFDFQQEIEETFSITIHNPQSITAIGAVRESMRGALEGKSTDAVAAEHAVLLYKNKISSIPPKNYAVPVVGLTNSADVLLTSDTNRAAADAAMETLIDIAKTRIFSAARRNSVDASVPLNPALDVDKTVEINAAGVQAKGKVRHLVHRMDTDSGAATTDLTLALCSVAGVGISHPSDATVAPAGSSDGTSSTLAAPSVTWNGLAGQDQVITIAFPAVADAERDLAAIPVSATIRAPLVEDVFNITIS